MRRRHRLHQFITSRQPRTPQYDPNLPTTGQPTPSFHFDPNLGVADPAGGATGKRVRKIK